MVTIKGKRVNLRPHKLSDAPNWVKWFADEEVTRYLTAQPVNLEQERKWIKSTRKARISVFLAIETKAGKHIGSVSLRNVDGISHHAVLGVIIGNKDYWGEGYGHEVTELILDYAFKKKKLNKVYLLVRLEHKKAIALYKKIGFKKEGLLKKHLYKNGKYHDCYQMYILKKDFLNN